MVYVFSNLSSTKSVTDPRDVPGIVLACFNEFISFNLNGIIRDLVTIFTDPSAADIVIDFPDIS
jgi:hypothetical protein